MLKNITEGNRRRSSDISITMKDSLFVYVPLKKSAADFHEDFEKLET